MNLKNYILAILFGTFLIVGCQKEVIVPVNEPNQSSLRGGEFDGIDFGGITDPNNEDEDEDDKDDITVDGDNGDIISDDDENITDPNNEDEDEDDDR